MLAPRCQDGSITWTSCYNNSGDLSHFIFPFSRNWRFFSVVKTMQDLFQKERKIYGFVLCIYLLTLSHALVVVELVGFVGLCSCASVPQLMA
jgi:hypothetical protein